VWDGVAQGGLRVFRVCTFRSACLILCFATLFFFTAQPAIANDSDKSTPVPWREIWVGADATENTWLVYSGMTLSPFGHIHGLA